MCRCISVCVTEREEGTYIVCVCASTYVCVSVYVYVCISVEFEKEGVLYVCVCEHVDI